jgi:hypothetical protein
MGPLRAARGKLPPCAPGASTTTARNPDDDLAVLARGEAAREGSGRLGECEHRVDLDAKLAAVDEARKLHQLLPARFHDEVPPFSARLLGDRDEAAAIREQAGRALEELAANRVEEKVDRSDLVVELPPAIDHLMRAECSRSLERLRRRRCHHVGATPPSQLRRELADTAYRSVDEDPLAGLEAAVREQALPSAEPGSGTAALST